MPHIYYEINNQRIPFMVSDICAREWVDSAVIQMTATGTELVRWLRDSLFYNEALELEARLAESEVNDIGNTLTLEAIRRTAIDLGRNEMRPMLLSPSPNSSLFNLDLTQIGTITYTGQMSQPMEFLDIVLDNKFIHGTKPIKEKIDMTKLLKFEDGKLIFDTSSLKTKQKRNVLKLIQRGNTQDALDYTAQGLDKQKRKIRALSNMRDSSKEVRQGLDGSIFNRQTEHIWKLFARTFNVSNPKTPQAIPKGEAIGVEIEFFMPRDGFPPRSCGDCGHCENGDHSECEEAKCGFDAAKDFFTKKCTELRIKGINLGEDGSIDCDDDVDEIPLEARILTNVNDLSNLEKFCKLLKDVGAKVNKSCGLHVHLDFRTHERRPSISVNKLAKVLPMLKAMVPKSRINNTYCRSDVGSTSTEGGRDTRYSCINDIEAFSKFKTIEIRLHSGTINFTKIKHWIKILYSVAHCEGNLPDLTIESYAAKLNWSATLVTYIMERIKKFNPDNALLGESAGINVLTPEQAAFDQNHEDSEAA